MKRSESRRSDLTARTSVPRLKLKRCRSCKEQFAPKTGQIVCSLNCAVKLVQEKREKTERIADRKQREKLKPRSKWMSEAQAAVNAYIRARDAFLPCISCNRHHDGQYHAGHYLSTGARPELRFDEANIHKQCQPCNTHLHGNLILYRVALIEKIGPVEVERLEGPQLPMKYTVDELLAIRDKYRWKIREMRSA